MSDQDPNPPAEPSPGWSQTSALAPSPNVQATMNQMTVQLQSVIDAAERAASAIRFDAEEQARNHLAEAQRRADRLTAERVGLIAELTDDLISHAGTVRDHSEQMVKALEDAIASVTTKLEQPALANPFPPMADSPAAGDAIDDEPQSTLEDEFTASTPEALGSSPEASAVGERDDPPIEADPEESGAEVEIRPEEPDEDEEPGSAQEAVISDDALLHATRLAVAGNDRETIAAALREQFDIDDPGPVVNRVLGET